MKDFIIVPVVLLAFTSLIVRGQRFKPCPSDLDPLFEGEAKSVDCLCRKYHIYWPEDGLCYPQYSKGPCQEGHKLVYDELIGRPVCRCHAYHIKWTDGKCYEQHTKGPCEKGKLFVASNVTGEGECVCDPALSLYYHAATGKCFELYSMGPCPQGKITKFNYETGQPECMCKDGFVEWDDGNCYELNSKGPCGSVKCEKGVACFVHSLEKLKTDCACVPASSYSKDDKCYLPYSIGPCRVSEWLVYKPDGTSECLEKKNCIRFENWFFNPSDSQCYREFTRGPCPDGTLFYLDKTSGEISCSCNPSWKPYYWPENGKCYAQSSLGPCLSGKYFKYNHTAGKTECSCFKSHVPDLGAGVCYEVHSQGNCRAGEIVIADPASGNALCTCDKSLTHHYWEQDSRCYPHYEQGPCSSGMMFRLSDETKKPACIIWG